MPKIMILDQGPFRKSVTREIPCGTLGEDGVVTNRFTVIVINNDGEITVSLEDMENKTLLPRQIEMHESEYLFWKQIFEKVIPSSQGEESA